MTMTMTVVGVARGVVATGVASSFRPYDGPCVEQPSNLSGQYCELPTPFLWSCPENATPPWSECQISAAGPTSFCCPDPTFCGQFCAAILEDPACLRNVGWYHCGLRCAESIDPAGVCSGEVRKDHLTCYAKTGLDCTTDDDPAAPGCVDEVSEFHQCTFDYDGIAATRDASLDASCLADPTTSYPYAYTLDQENYDKLLALYEASNYHIPCVGPTQVEPYVVCCSIW